MDTNELTKLPICPICKERELTNEEVAAATNGRGTCWYCVADTFIDMQMEDQIPDPVRYGRRGESKEERIKYRKEMTLKPPIDANAAINGTPPAPGHVAPAIPGKTLSTQLRFNDQERKDFANKFGMDPVPNIKPSEVIVYGATEDTYLKFSIPLPIDVKEEQEIKRIMGGMLEIFGKLMKYGPQFASTLIELQAINPEMFLGRK